MTQFEFMLFVFVVPAFKCVAPELLPAVVVKLNSLLEFPEFLGQVRTQQACGNLCVTNSL